MSRDWAGAKSKSKSRLTLSVPYRVTVEIKCSDPGTSRRDFYGVSRRGSGVEKEIKKTEKGRGSQARFKRVVRCYVSSNEVFRLEFHIAVLTV